MLNLISPIESQLLTNQWQHLEMVILLVTHHVYLLIHVKLVEPIVCRTNILRHVNGSPVIPQQQLVIQPITGKISPHASGIFPVKHAVSQTFQHEVTSFLVSLWLEIYFVKRDTHHFIGLVKTFQYPIVHGPPQGNHLLIPGLPLTQHLLSLQQYRGLLLRLLFRLALLYQFLDLRLILLVKTHVIIPHEMISLSSRTLRSSTVGKLLPRNHTLADMNTPIVHQVHHNHVMPVCLLNLGNRPSQKIIPDMSQMQRFIRVRWRIFNHVGLPARLLRITIFFLFCHVIQHLDPVSGRNHHVQKPLNHVVGFHLFNILFQILSQLFSRFFGRFSGISGKRENDYRQITGKFLPGFLQLYVFLG